jgi:hypothetical protein
MSALDAHVERVARLMGVSPSTARRNLKAQNPELYKRLDLLPADPADQPDRDVATMQRYIDEQGTREIRDDAVFGESPWPSAENPVLGVLVRKALAEWANGDSTLEHAFLSATVHAWFEATIAAQTSEPTFGHTI